MSPRYYRDRDLIPALLRRHMRAHLADVARAARWPPTEGHPMPELGGKKLASDFGSMMADVRKAIDAAKGTVQAAVRELQTEITTGAAQAAKAIRIEATTVRDGYAQLLGNAPPEETNTSEPGPIPATGTPSTMPPAPQLHRDTGDPVK